MSEQMNDIIVVGAGIAGMSAAAELATQANVLVLEAESQAGYHATGRSAAYFASAYGNEIVRGITAASEPFYRNPPDGFCEADLIRPRDCIFVGRDDQSGSLQRMATEVPSLAQESAADVRAEIPIFKEEYLAGGLRDRTGGDLDVDAILQGYLRLLKQRGGVLKNKAIVDSIRYESGTWHVRCDDQAFQAGILVNAAGAWADTIAGLAGLDALGIVPMRRTAILIDAPGTESFEHWPLVIDVDEQFYFKPDAGQLLISPANEDESPPCDAQADELDIAIAVDRFMNACDVDFRRINHSWAGLRTFAPDKSFVAGFDPRASGFYWLAGQGGYGVQSAPGLAQLSAHQILKTDLLNEWKTLEKFADGVSPVRFL